MANIERAPFRGNWRKLLCLTDKDVQTTNSVVGKITAPGGKEWVIKWPRQRIYHQEEGWIICQYLTMAYQLYQKALGEEFLVPSKTKSLETQRQPIMSPRTHNEILRGPI